MQGMAESREYGGYEMPLLEVFEEVMSILNGEREETDEGKRVMADYKKKILGNTSLKHAPSLYWDIGTVIDMGFLPSQWFETSLEDRALIIARNHLRNAAEIIDAYYRDQDEQKKKLAEKSKKSNG